jgi:hypothetical protein
MGFEDLDDPPLHFQRWDRNGKLDETTVREVEATVASRRELRIE